MKDFKAPLGVLVRAALDEGVELQTLIENLCEVYKAERATRPQVTRPPKIGSFVVYSDLKKGLQTASVLEVLVLENHPFGLLKIRVRLNARPDYDVSNVAYSEKPTAGHWSYRTGPGR